MVIPLINAGVNAALGVTIVPGAGRFKTVGVRTVGACAAAGPSAKENDKAATISRDAVLKRNASLYFRDTENMGVLEVYNFVLNDGTIRLQNDADKPTIPRGNNWEQQGLSLQISDLLPKVCHIF